VIADSARGFWLIVSTTWRVDWRRSLGTLLEPAGQAAAPLFGLWLALLVNGALRRDVTLITFGAGGIAVFQSLSYAANVFGVSIRLTLSEAVGHAFDQQITALTASLPGLEHHELRQHQDRLELLRQTQGVLGQSLDSLVRTTNAVITAIVTLVLLISADPVLFILVAFGLPSIWAARAYGRWIRSAEETSAEPRRLAQHLRDLITDHEAGAELRMGRLQNEVIARHRATWLSSQTPILRAQQRRTVISVAEQSLFTVGLASAIGYTLWQATRGRASIGDVLLVAVVGQQVPARVLGPIYSIANSGQVLRAAGRLIWLQDYVSNIASDRTGDHPAPVALAEGIVLERLSFSYPQSSNPVLSDICVRMPAGSVVALVGENGAGKTSLIKLLCRLYAPTGGKIVVDGIDLAHIEVSSWRSKITAAFQDFARFELRTQQAVGIGELRSMNHEETVLRAVEQAGASSLVSSLPDQLSTQLGSTWDRGVDLSVGQWQTLALSRAFMRRSSILVLFDEPTASLDATTEHALFERYAAAIAAGWSEGAITILVSHRFSTVRMADLILVLRDGRLIEQGSHEELVRRGGHYAYLYDLQARSYR
jgi:ATP-binding cassette subfamily B protein